MEVSMVGFRTEFKKPHIFTLYESNNPSHMISQTENLISFFAVFSLVVG
jgi:hypothetical protein